MSASDSSKIEQDLRLPAHVAIIMDGNGRWAKQRHLPRVEGHRAGAKTVRMVVEESRRLGIKHVTLYAFSTENWQRPQEEVWALMKLFERYLVSEQELLIKNNIRLKVIGNRERLPEGVQRAIINAEAATSGGTAMELILAVSYGAREEITATLQKLLAQVEQGTLKADQVNEQLISDHLYTANIPDPDLLIRTSDEFRISNFLLWQLAYAEIVVTPVLWPDFNQAEYLRCLQVFSARNRRYGLTEEQLKRA